MSFLTAPQSCVDISGLNKVDLLFALWNKQKIAPFFVQRQQILNFDYDLAFEAVKEPIDYFCGRPVKADLSRDFVIPDGYDEQYNRTGYYNGERYFETITEDLRNASSGPQEKYILVETFQSNYETNATKLIGVHLFYSEADTYNFTSKFLHANTPNESPWYLKCSMREIYPEREPYKYK